MGFLKVLWFYLLTSAPYLMLGLLISGIAHRFLTTEFIKRTLGGRSVWGIFKASLLGIPLPLCSCSVIPTAVTLKKSGASNATTSSFLIATPESGVDSISITYGLMDIPTTIMRPVAAFASATLAGFLQFFFNDSQEKLKDEKSFSSCHRNPSALPSKPEKKRGFLGSLVTIFHYGFYQLLRDISVWLAIGLILGAVLLYFIPENLFYQLSATEGRLMILIIAIPFYICAGATTPLAAALIIKGLSPGTGLLLLLVGPATNLSNLMILQKYIGKKGVLLNLVAIISVALGFSYLTDFLYSFFQWELNFRISHAHESEHHGGLFAAIITVIFIAALLYSLKSEFLSFLRKKKEA